MRASGQLAMTMWRVAPARVAWRIGFGEAEVVADEGGDW